MDNSIKLFQLIKNETDQRTAEDAISSINGTIKDEVTRQATTVISLFKTEFTDKLHALEVKLTNKINDLEVRLILWVVAMSVIQLVARYFFR